MHDYFLGLGARIRQVRGDLSQPKFAKRLTSDEFTLTPQSVMNYEKGHRIPPLDVLSRIIEVFEVDKVWLLFGEEEKKDYSIAVPDWVPEEGKEFFIEMITAMKVSPYMFYEFMMRWPKIKKANHKRIKPILEALYQKETKEGKTA